MSDRLVIAFRMLVSHPLRTALSVSGLLVGVAAVTVMASVGAGAERQVLAGVRALGTNLLIVTAAPAPRVAGRARQTATLTLLRAGDATAIAEEGYLAVRTAPAVRASLVVSWEGRNSPTTVVGTTPDGLRIRNIQAARGRSFDDGENDERRRVALLGAAVARALFGGVDPVGREVRIGRTPFDVIGVMRRRGTDAAGADLDHEIAIPLETAMRRVLNIPYVHSLLVQGRSSGELPALEGEVREILGRRLAARSGVAEPFVVQNQAVLLRTERGAARALRRLTVGVGALGLVVGGVGIFALMLMSVRERTDEIGLRRAVGARRRDIRRQFLLESALLASAGGAAGVLAGLIATGIAAALGPWDLLISWPAVTLGLLSSLVLGFAGGVFPASRAARLAPVDALRAST